MFWLPSPKTRKSPLRVRRRILLDGAEQDYWSRRASKEIRDLRAENPTVHPNGIVLSVAPNRNRARLWTFAGVKANAEIAARLGVSTGSVDNYSIHLTSRKLVEAVADREHSVIRRQNALSSESTLRLKFVECLPENLLRQIRAARLSDDEAVRPTLSSRLVVKQDGTFVKIPRK